VDADDTEDGPMCSSDGPEVDCSTTTVGSWPAPELHVAVNADAVAVLAVGAIDGHFAIGMHTTSGQS